MNINDIPTSRDGVNRLSFSIIRTLEGMFWIIDLVMLPGPGPTSHTSQSLTDPADRTMRLINLGSIKKFWESSFIARSLYSLIKSLILGKGGSRIIWLTDIMSVCNLLLFNSDGRFLEIVQECFLFYRINRISVDAQRNAAK